MYMMLLKFLLQFLPLIRASLRLWTMGLEDNWNLVCLSRRNMLVAGAVYDHDTIAFVK